MGVEPTVRRFLHPLGRRAEEREDVADGTVLCRACGPVAQGSEEVRYVVLQAGLVPRRDLLDVTDLDVLPPPRAREVRGEACDDERTRRSLFGGFLSLDEQEHVLRVKQSGPMADG